jgi:hypothetical protein
MTQTGANTDLQSKDVLAKPSQIFLAGGWQFHRAD